MPDLPGRMLGRMILGLDSPAPVDGRAAAHAFQAIAMERTNSREGIIGMTRHPQMSDLRMHRAMNEPSAGKHARAESGADGDVGHIAMSAGGPELALRQRGRIHIRVQGERRVGKR